MSRLALALLLSSVALSGAAAADLAPMSVEPSVPMYVPVAAFDWTGFYVGVNAGYGVGRSDASTTFEDPYTNNPLAIQTRGDTTVSVGDWWSGGGVVGAHAGYQVQLGAFVLGGELSAAWSDIGGDDTATITNPNFGTIEGSLRTDLNWLAEARIKAGFAIDRGLIYAIGGVAAGEVENAVSFTTPSDTQSWSAAETNYGWTLGLGLEYAVTDNVIIGIEAKHVDLTDDNTVDVEGQDVTFENDFNIAEVKASYKF